jgi:hypothetical protein
MAATSTSTPAEVRSTFSPYTSLMWNIPDSEMRRRRTEALYEVEMGCKKVGSSLEFVYNEGRYTEARNAPETDRHMMI